jgi:hypothetical protein
MSSMHKFAFIDKNQKKAMSYEILGLSSENSVAQQFNIKNLTQTLKLSLYSYF